MRAAGSSRIAWLFGLFLAIGIPAALAMGRYQPATMDHNGDIFGDSEFVVLEPEEWIGKRFPLLKYIDLGEQLASGEWSVVLYHYECPDCKRLLTILERMARHNMSHMSPFAGKVALVEVPPYTLPMGSAASDRWWVHGRLDDLREWLVEAPVVIEMRNGEVFRVWDGKMLAVMETKGVRDAKPAPVFATGRSP